MDSHTDYKMVIDSLRNVQNYTESLKFNAFTASFAAVPLAYKAFPKYFKHRQGKKPGSTKDKLPGKKKPRPDKSTPLKCRRTRRKYRRTRRTRRKAKGAGGKRVINTGGLMNVGPLTLSVHAIVQQCKSRDRVFKEMEEKIIYCQEAEQAYNYCMKGYREYSDDALNEAAARLELSDKEDSDEESADEEDEGELNRKYEKAKEDFVKVLRANKDFKKTKHFFAKEDPSQWKESDDFGFANGVQRLIKERNGLGTKKISAIRSILSTCARC